MDTLKGLIAGPRARLFDAVRRESLKDLKKVLQTTLANLTHARDTEGRTALHIAAMVDCVEIVAFLIKKGWDTCALDEDGMTPFMHAVCVQKKVSLILPFQSRGGAALELYKTVGTRSESLKSYRYSDGASILMLIADRNLGSTTEDMISLLVEDGFNVNHQDSEGKTVLIRCIERGYLMSALVLLEYPEVDVIIRDRTGRTALDYYKEDNSDVYMRLVDRLPKVFAATYKPIQPLVAKRSNRIENPVDISCDVQALPIAIKCDQDILQTHTPVQPTYLSCDNTISSPRGEKRKSTLVESRIRPMTPAIGIETTIVKEPRPQPEPPATFEPVVIQPNPGPMKIPNFSEFTCVRTKIAERPSSPTSANTNSTPEQTSNTESIPIPIPRPTITILESYPSSNETKECKYEISQTLTKVESKPVLIQSTQVKIVPPEIPSRPTTPRKFQQRFVPNSPPPLFTARPARPERPKTPMIVQEAPTIPVRPERPNTPLRDFSDVVARTQNSKTSPIELSTTSLPSMNMFTSISASSVTLAQRRKKPATGNNHNRNSYYASTKRDSSIDGKDQFNNEIFDNYHSIMQSLETMSTKVKSP
eukprot:CFRG7199T1